jgi:ABC-2 type transport system permease protein
VTGGWVRLGVVAAASWRGALSGYRAVGLALIAALYPMLVLALASGHRADVDLLSASEELYSVLFLPLLLLLVCLVLGVSEFRTEIEEDTLVYPLTRSVPRAAVLAGKFLGFVGAALCFLLPTALLGPGLAVAFNAGPQVALSGVLPTLVITTMLATVAYGSFFLLLGLLTRQALVIGLLYGFFWETFLPLLPGPLKQLSVIYYLRAVGGQLVAAGPLAAGGTTVSLGAAVLVPILFAMATGALAWVYLTRAEIRPAPAAA